MKIKLVFSFILGSCSTFLVFLFMTGLVGAQGKSATRGMEFIVVEDGVVCSFPLMPKINLIEESCSCWYLGRGEGLGGLGGGCNALHLSEEDFGTLPKCDAQ